MAVTLQSNRAKIKYPPATVGGYFIYSAHYPIILFYTPLDSQSERQPSAPGT